MGTITVSGIGNSNAQSAMNGTLTIRNTNNTNLLGIGARKTTKAAKKPLNYNHREISGQITRAKRAQSASTVLTRAKSKLAVLQRAAGTGQYDSREMANAIAHARRMVRCAQLKVRNLKEEEREQKAHSRENSAKKQQRQGEIKRRAAQKERQLKEKITLEESQEVLREKRKRNEMMQRRRMHRNQEQNKISEADMKYIKGQMENGSGSYSMTGQGAVLDLSVEAAALAEVLMLEQQIQAEVEAEVAAELGTELGGTSDVSGSAGAGMPSTGGSDTASAAEAAPAMDVSV